MAFRAWVSAVAATLLVSCAPSTENTAPSSGTEATAETTAPDFTLQLGDGGTFTLSAETRPVFMVFWAEW
jgi:hypothetical protein